MLPILFPGTAFETPTYYLLYLLGALGAIIIGIYKAKAYGLPPHKVVDYGFLCFLWGVLGARIFHVIVEAPSYYWEHPVRIFYLWQGGFVLYGGIILGFLGSWLTIKLAKDSFARWTDVAPPMLFVGVGIGRMGCLAGGCCHGSPTDWAWGLIFTNPSSSAPLHIPLHPTQLLESLFCFLMAIVFWFSFPKVPKRHGLPLALSFMAYAVFRFFIEFLRGDLDRGLYAAGAISTSQIVSLVVVALSLGWIFLWKPKTAA